MLLIGFVVLVMTWSGSFVLVSIVVGPGDVPAGWFCVGYCCDVGWVCGFVMRLITWFVCYTHVLTGCCLVSCVVAGLCCLLIVLECGVSLFVVFVLLRCDLLVSGCVLVIRLVVRGAFYLLLLGVLFALG